MESYAGPAVVANGRNFSATVAVEKALGSYQLLNRFVMNATVRNIFSRVLMLSLLLCGTGSACSRSLDFASSEEEFESVQESCVPTNTGPDGLDGHFSTKVSTMEGVDLYFDYAAGRGLHATYQKPGMAFPQSVASYPVLRDTAGNSQRWSTLTLEEARLLTRDRKWGMSGSGILQDLGVRVRGGMQEDDSENLVTRPGDMNIPRASANPLPATAAPLIPGSTHTLLDRSSSSLGTSGSSSDQVTAQFGTVTPTNSGASALTPEISDLTKRKLLKPDLVLTIDQSIEVISNCLAMGRDRVEKARGKDLLMFIGNTGSGKSTAVNYLHGCEMEYKKKRSLGLSGSGGVVRVVPDSSGPKELMPIGHDKVSRTFLPDIASDQYFTYCDCPGFFDDHGFEISIANAVNIHSVASVAKSVRLFLLIDYQTFKLPRRHGLDGIHKILLDLLGNESCLRSHMGSVLMGVTQVPTSGKRAPKSVSQLRKNLARDSLLSAYQDQLETFDPLDDCLEGGLKRDALIKRLRDLPAISNLGNLFKTVLLAEDERKLREIEQELNARIQQGLSGHSYDQVRSSFQTFDRLNSLDHIYVRGLYGSLKQSLQRHVNKQYANLTLFSTNSQFTEAEAIVRRLGDLSSKMSDLPDCAFVDKRYRSSQSFLSNARARDAALRGSRAKFSALDDELGEVRSELSSFEVHYSDSQKLTSDLKAERQKTQDELQAGRTYLERDSAPNQAETKAKELTCEKSALERHRQELAALAPKNTAMQQLLDLKRLLGNNYLGAEVWKRLGVRVSDRDLPKVSDALLSSVHSLQKKGECPLLMLDLGESIENVENLCKKYNISALSTESRRDEQLRSELIYSIRPLIKSWLLVPSSDYGVLPGSRSKTYQDQVSYMTSNYFGYEVGSVRELVTLSMLKCVQDGVVLFPRSPWTYGRCVEHHRVGCLKGCRMVLGANRAGPGRLSGLVVASTTYGFSNFVSNSGLFGVRRFIFF